MKKILFFLALCQTFTFLCRGQYAPQAGILGSTAVHKSDPSIKNWANHCSVIRGFQDISQPSLGLVSSGDSSLAIGPADQFVVSLGDSGVALLSFPYPIHDGPGADFLVFENGFVHPSDPELAYSELAFVEVSSDGINFFRFPAVSLTQTDTQIAGAGEYMQARKINNLAGKYISNYGTPFDLQELDGIAGLDINNVTHVRIVDVIGSVDGHASFDKNNRIINDPYPTPYPTGGFDLDAIGVIHQKNGLYLTETIPKPFSIYPRPATTILNIESSELLTLQVSDLGGHLIFQSEVSGKLEISVTDWSPGMYLLHFKNKEGYRWSERLFKL